MSKNDSKVHINDAKRQRIVRRELDLSQSTLAKVLGCDPKTIWNRENAKTEISQADRRRLGELSGVDVAPLNAADDPRSIVLHFREIREVQSVSKLLAQHKTKPTLQSFVLRLRAWNIFRDKNYLSPLHSRYDSTVSFVYLLATTILVVEQFQRSNNGGWEQYQFGHDILFVLSAAILAILIVPAIMTISWKVDDNLMSS